jgi:cell volume regulation protein A
VETGELVLITGCTLVAALIATMVASRVRLPGLLLFLGLGMAVGSDGLGLIDFNDFELAQEIGIIALAAILFEGGLTAGWSVIKPVLRPAISLATVGTIVTAIIAGLFAAWLFDLPILSGLLVGSILASTDSAAIFSVLRASSLRRRLARTLEAESGLNDPMAVLLVIGFIDWIQLPDYGLLDMLVQFARQLSIGLAAGCLVGWLGVLAFRRITLPSAGLYPVTSVAIGALAFGAADIVHGSGFLAVYLAGVILGSARIPARRTVQAFHEGTAWVAQIAVFFVLGLLVFPNELLEVAPKATLVALVLAIVARPVAAAVATALDKFSLAERLMLGWAGLRGALPVVLATFPVVAGISRSQEFFDIAFWAVLFSTLLQGTTFEAIARRLGVTTDEPALPRPLAETGTIRRLGAEVIEYPVAPDDAIVGARIRDLGLPREALVSLIVRDGEALPPRGSTKLVAGDRLHLVVRNEVASELDRLLDLWHTGPIGPPPAPSTRPRSYAAISSIRPWRPGDGNPARPSVVSGVPVVRDMRTRRDLPGALVELQDGRVAVTGPVLVMGPRRAVRRYAIDRLRRKLPEGEREWWEEVAGAVGI